MRYLVPWQVIGVRGQSMTPTLLDGDHVIVRHGRTVAVGDVVSGFFLSRPDLRVIKRATAGNDVIGWTLSSDNSRAGSDTRDYGPATVDAVAVLVIPGRTRRELARRRRETAADAGGGHPSWLRGSIALIRHGLQACLDCRPTRLSAAPPDNL